MAILNGQPTLKTVLNSGFQVVVSGFQVLDFGFLVSGTWIMNYLR